MTTSAILTAEDLVDPYSGIIRALHPVDRLDGMPDRYVGLTAEIADTRAHGNWPSDLVSLGTTFADDAGARIAAIGEAVERYCGNYVPPGLLRATARELRDAGVRHLGPTQLNFFAPWQLQLPRFPFTQFTADTSIAWSEGFGADGLPTLVPASYVYLNWRTGRRKSEPWLHHLNYAGIATGVGLEDAATRGLLELVERDSLSLWWHLNLPARGIDLDSIPGLIDDLGGTRLRCHLLELPAFFGVPVVAAVVHDPELGIVAGGFSAKLDPAETARKAVLEAIHSWVFTRGLTDADGWVFKSMEAGVLSPGLYLDHRADREYLEAAGTRSEHIRDLGAQAQVWLDPRTQQQWLPRFTEPESFVGISELPAGDIGSLKRQLHAAGHDVVVCDITTPDVALTPLRVARVCAGGLVPNAPAAFPYFGLGRWGDVARAASVAGDPNDPESLVLVPPTEPVNPFRIFVVARSICWSGNAVTLVALPLLVYQQEGSALLSGIAFAVESLPYLLFGLFAGALADRFDRKVVLVASQVLSAIALATIPLASAVGSVVIPHVLMVGFLVSTLFVFFDAASFGVVPELVGRDGIASATAILVSTGTVIGIAGPLLGGVAAAAMTPAGAIAVDAGCFVCAALITATVAIPASARTPGARQRVWAQIGEGVRYIWHQPVVRVLTMVGIGVSLANGVVVGLMVVVGVRQLGLGDDDGRLGALYAATALGAFLISLGSARIQRRVDTGKITLVGIGVAAVAMLAWAHTMWFTASLLILVVYQAANTMVVVNGIVVRQSITPDHLQSRVNTTARMIAMGGTPFGAASGGALAQVAGVGVAVSMGAAALIVAGGVGWYLGVGRLPLLVDLTAGADGERD